MPGGRIRASTFLAMLLCSCTQNLKVGTNVRLGYHTGPSSWVPHHLGSLLADPLPVLTKKHHVITTFAMKDCYTNHVVYTWGGGLRPTPNPIHACRDNEHRVITMSCSKGWMYEPFWLQHGGALRPPNPTLLHLLNFDFKSPSRLPTSSLPLSPPRKWHKGTCVRLVRTCTGRSGCSALTRSHCVWLLKRTLLGSGTGGRSRL